MLIWGGAFTVTFALSGAPRPPLMMPLRLQRVRSNEKLEGSLRVCRDHYGSSVRLAGTVAKRAREGCRRRFDDRL